MYPWKDVPCVAGKIVKLIFFRLHTSWELTRESGKGGIWWGSRLRDQAFSAEHHSLAKDTLRISDSLPGLVSFHTKQACAGRSAGKLPVWVLLATMQPTQIQGEENCRTAPTLRVSLHLDRNVTRQRNVTASDWKGQHSLGADISFWPRLTVHLRNG